MPVTAEARAPGGAPAGAPSPAIRALVCDWAGVLTNPISEILRAYCDAAGVDPGRIGAALARDGGDSFAELERGRLTEAAFLERVGAALAADGGAPVDLGGFRRTWFAGVRPNRVFLAYLGGLRRRGLALALLTNNVREWDPLWRATLSPLDVFSVVVSSAEEGVRKPEHAIYERTLDRVGLPAAACLFVDDMRENCDAARACGLEAVWFRSTSQAIGAIEERLFR